MRHRLATLLAYRWVLPAQPVIVIALQDALAIVNELPHGVRHLGFALDALDIQILGVLVRPVIGVHRLAQRLRGASQSLLWSP